MDIYRLIGPLVRRLDPERAHGLAIGGLKAGIVPVTDRFDDPVLRVELWGCSFANPIGMAAGFDKHAEAIDPLFAQGFGCVEIGSVTPQPQPGNPKPRMFRLTADGAAINRMGFNSEGADAVAARLAARARGRTRPGVLGVNLGKNKTTEDAAADYVIGATKLGAFADYVVVNVSSPNTPGLRALQGRAPLEKLLTATRDALVSALPGKAPPLVLKIAPDLTEDDKRDIAAVALELKLDGLICTNTTIARPPELADPQRKETGGLSGRPLFKPSTAVLSDMYRLTEGKIPLIGVGGIETGEQAYDKIRAGASLVQFYTAMIYHGPGLANRIKRELAACLRRDGFASVSHAVGADHMGGRSR